MKRVQINGRVNAEFRGEFLNAFNHPVLLGGATAATNLTGNRTVQLVSRVNW